MNLDGVKADETNKPWKREYLNICSYATLYMVVSDNPEIIAFHKIVG